MGRKLGINDLLIGTLLFGLILPVKLNLSPENLRHHAGVKNDAYATSRKLSLISTFAQDDL